MDWSKNLRVFVSFRIQASSRFSKRGRIDTGVKEEGSESEIE